MAARVERVRHQGAAGRPVLTAPSSSPDLRALRAGGTGRHAAGTVGAEPAGLLQDDRRLVRARQHLLVVEQLGQLAVGELG
jgi:hypothetical protein